MAPYAQASGIDSQPDSVVGTPAYVAPEVMRRGKYNGMVSEGREGKGREPGKGGEIFAHWDLPQDFREGSQERRGDFCPSPPSHFLRQCLSPPGLRR